MNYNICGILILAITIAQKEVSSFVSPSSLYMLSSSCVHADTDHVICPSRTNALRENGSNVDTPVVLCELQTFLRLIDAVPTGGMAKTVIQAGHCRLNGQIETRRAKKLYTGDTVQIITPDMDPTEVVGAEIYDVAQHVALTGYVYNSNPKVKKARPIAKVLDDDGTLEFGGRYRDEDWRRQRKDKKAERKRHNQTVRKTTIGTKEEWIGMNKL